MIYQQNGGGSVQSAERVVAELKNATLLCRATHCDATLYTFDGGTSPSLMNEVRRLRKISFQGVGVTLNDEQQMECGDTDGSFRQLVLWNNSTQAVMGGYRYAVGRELAPSRLTLSRYFHMSEDFIRGYLPVSLELGRTFIAPDYQRTSGALYTLDALWEGLAVVVARYDIQYLVGRVTLYPSLGVRARNLLMGFMRYIFPGREGLLQARYPFYGGVSKQSFRRLFVGDTVRENYKILLSKMRDMHRSVPPIISSYMRLSPSMQSFDSYINYDLGGVVETAIMLTINDFYDDIKRRYINRC